MSAGEEQNIGKRSELVVVAFIVGLKRKNTRKDTGYYVIIVMAHLDFGGIAPTNLI